MAQNKQDTKPKPPKTVTNGYSIVLTDSDRDKLDKLQTKFAQNSYAAVIRFLIAKEEATA